MTDTTPDYAGLSRRLGALAYHIQQTGTADSQDAEAVLEAASAITELVARAEAAEARVKEIEAYAREATAAITGLTSGGSENFGKRIGDLYTADLPLCVARIRERMGYRMDKLRAEARLAEAMKDRDRLDFLDDLNRRLNAHCGTNYRWEMVINHNVNRLMLKFPYGIDLNDAKAHGFNSCRDVIDREMARIAASRAARQFMQSADAADSSGQERGEGSEVRADG